MKHIKIIFVTFVVTAIIGIWADFNVEAKMVEDEKNTKSITLQMLNDEIDSDMDQLVFRIFNNTDSKIKVSKTKIQIKQDGKWTEIEKNLDLKIKGKMKIPAGDNKYGNIDIKNNYAITDTGLPTGYYRLYVRYKLKNKFYYTIEKFYIENSNEINIEDGKHSDDAATQQGMPAKPDAEDGNSVSKAPEISNEEEPKEDTLTVKHYLTRVISYDFSLKDNGKATAMVFFEGQYKKIRKVNITIKIQKNIKGKWKKIKKYKVVQNSNLAFINKNINIKQAGTYRMSIKIKCYKKGKKSKNYEIKTKSQKY